MADSVLLLGIITAVFVTIISGFVYSYLSHHRKSIRQKLGKSEEFVADCKGDVKSHEDDLDLLDYSNRIQREIKLAKQKAALKEIESQMTAEQVEEERQTQRKQLEDIFRLMAEQKEHFGINSVDDVKDQMKLYV